MAIIWPVVAEKDGPTIGYSFYCPGCEHHHLFTTHESQRLVWTFNGDLKKPTFAPSLVNTTLEADEQRVCHLFVRKGQIQYLNDCWHELKGQTVLMEELE